MDEKNRLHNEIIHGTATKEDDIHYPGVKLTNNNINK